MALSDSYCTSSDLRDVYPQIDEFDTKLPLFGWVIDDNLAYIYNSGTVNRLYSAGRDLGLPQSTSGAVDSVDDWYYDSSTDRLWYYFGSSNTSPVDLLVESGEDWSGHQTDIIKKASRYFDSRVDATISRDQFKDKNGEYDYLVVRTTALIACSFLITAHNPVSEIADQIKEEFNFNIELINSGKAKLSHQISGDSSQGIVREVVSPQNANPLYLVDTRGSYTGSSYDLIKVVISTAGVIGTGKFDVYVKDSDGLKNNQVVTAEKITGDYQSIGNGLYVRFQGKDSSSAATVGATPDEWEIEVWGKGEELADVGINAVRTVGMTRGGYGVWQ